ncbi:MAG: protein kinase [Planctomycetes bacterium]|nr:protein kinase [Planctomycetota bacterium]
MSWSQVRREFERLCDLPPAAVAARLAALAATDRGLAQQVRELLAQDAAAPQFLERGPQPLPGARSVTFAAAGARLGRYELVRPLGSGGMGAVWEARQAEPQRRVAIKLVVRGGRSEAERWRFRHEVQVLAQLRHPAIATLFEAGEDEVGDSLVSWFAMELVDGGTDLLSWARRHGLSREARLALFEQLGEAVDHGHRHGVLHRDLKPGNVLVDRDGRLQLIDFGVARAFGPDADTDGATPTVAGEIVGTLQYMAPEQLRGDSAAIGTAADVYALGVILYQLLCDRAPYDLGGVPFARIAAIVLEQEPRPPRAVVPDLPADLGWIVLHALQKDPARRYQTARALLDDLRRWRAHEPVSARVPSVGYRLAKAMRRHRIGAFVGAAVVTGLAVGGYGLWRGAETARARERVAVRANEVSREALRVVTDLFEGIEDTEASRDLTVHELLVSAVLDEGATTDPAVEQALRELRGRTFARLRRYPEARAELERAWLLQGLPGGGPLQATDPVLVREHGHVLAADLGEVLVHTGERERGAAMLRDAVAATAVGASDATRRKIVTTWCKSLAEQNAATELLTAAAELRQLAARTDNEASAMLAEQRTAQAAIVLGQHDLAIAASERVWQLARGRFGDAHKVTCSMLQVHVMALQLAGQLDRAEALYPGLITMTRAVFGEGSTSLLKVLNNRVHLLHVQGRSQAAIDGLRQIVAAYEARGGKMTPERVTAIHNLGQVLCLDNRFAEAEPYLRRAAEASQDAFAAEDPDGISMRFHLGACLAWQRRWSEAEPMLLAEYERLAAALPAGHADVTNARNTIADGYRVNGHPEQAAAWRVE